jgi:UDP-N-acetylmuramoylalanine--D-glutamate ligase
MNVPWGSGSWRRVLVYGLGLSGKAATQFLLRRGVEVVGVDRRERPELGLGAIAEEPGLHLVVGEDAPELPGGLDAVVVSPGVPPDRPLLAEARRRGLPVLGEVELAAPFLDGPVVAITGSNGKSTTTALTGALVAAAGLAVEVCGNIGEPITARVDGPPGRVFVVELSSFQLEGIELLHPRAAALLNVSPDHLDRHHSLAAYADAKRRVFLNQDAGDVAVLNADDPQARATVVRARRREFSRRGPVADGCHLDGDLVVEVGDDGAGGALFALADLAMPGVHNLENAMAAALLARAVGADAAAVGAGLRGFRGLPHRTERVRERGRVTWYDDSKGTNPAATAASLEGFPDGSVHLVLGGRNKGLDLGVLRELVARKARRLYFVGEAADELRRALGELAEHEQSGTLEAAVASAARAARPGEVVLLSPACASFDQFRDYHHRGEVFQQLVNALPEVEA